MAEDLTGKRVAILVSDGFEQSEMTQPREALRGAGADTVLVSPKTGTVKGWQKKNWGDEFQVDMSLEQAEEDDFDALVLPGGQINPDQLRQQPKAVQLVRDFFAAQKPVASICHGPWLLVEADVVCGRTVTSYPSIRTDLINAGADWRDEEVIADHGLITSRRPSDLDAFNRELIKAVAAGPNPQQKLPTGTHRHSSQPRWY